MGRSRTIPYTAFGESVSNALADRRMTQTELASSLNITVSYANQVMTGRKHASPRWADLVADVLKSSAAQRRELHKAAAVSAGYKLDLSPSGK